MKVHDFCMSVTFNSLHKMGGTGKHSPMHRKKYQDLRLQLSCREFLACIQEALGSGSCLSSAEISHGGL